MLSKQLRNGLVTAGVAAGAAGHSVGWVALAIAVLDDIAGTAPNQLRQRV